MSDIGMDLGVIWAVFTGLMLFGWGFDRLVAWMGRRGYTEGYLALLVAVGVLVTLGGVAILSWRGALLASGMPMILGSIGRYLVRREEARRAMIAEADARK